MGKAFFLEELMNNKVSFKKGNTKSEAEEAILLGCATDQAAKNLSRWLTENGETPERLHRKRAKQAIALVFSW